jgi:hypothetical protein
VKHPRRDTLLDEYEELRAAVLAAIDASELLQEHDAEGSTHVVAAKVPADEWLAVMRAALGVEATDEPGQAKERSEENLPDSPSDA